MDTNEPTARLHALGQSLWLDSISRELLDSGTLAMSSGPVYDPEGKRIGTFNSVWRREPDGSWKIVLDKGCPPCESSK